MDKFYNHNSFFGFLNSFRILPTNLYFGRYNSRTVSPPIIANPTFSQVARNWNLADTGAFISVYVAGLLLSKRITTQMEKAVYIGIKRSTFFHLSNLMFGVGIYVALTNSANRLNGHVPNGLTWDLPQTPKLKKFDYTSDFIKRNPFFRWLVPLQL